MASCTGFASEGGPVMPASTRSSVRTRPAIAVRSHAP